MLDFDKLKLNVFGLIIAFGMLCCPLLTNKVANAIDFGTLYYVVITGIGGTANAIFSMSSGTAVCISLVEANAPTAGAIFVGSITATTDVLVPVTWPTLGSMAGNMVNNFVAAEAAASAELAGASAITAEIPVVAAASTSGAAVTGTAAVAGVAVVAVGAGTTIYLANDLATNINTVASDPEADITWTEADCMSVNIFSPNYWYCFYTYYGGTPTPPPATATFVPYNPAPNF